MHFVQAKNILSTQNGMNIYRGCTHGCIYCDSRSKCYNFTHEFEDIEVKENAAELLEQRLISKRSKCMIGTGSMCDPYMHCEEKLMLTRRCLEVIDKYGFGAAIQTKSNRILRDLELIKSINEKSKCVVQITMTTYDEKLCRILEPNVCTTRERYEVLKVMQENNIPTVVWMTPILPFINDTLENVQGLLNYCIDAQVKGILIFGAGVTLREGDREYFYDALDRHFPKMKERYQKKYGYTYELTSENNDELMSLINGECKKHNIICNPDKVFEYLHEFPNDKQYKQMSLFD